MRAVSSLDDFVCAVLVGEIHQKNSATVETLHRWGLFGGSATDVVINENGRLDYFTFLQEARLRHPGKHLVAMHADLFFAEDFFHRLVAEVARIEAAEVAWGVLGPAGVTYPYFKIVRNMIDCHGILYPFGHPLPAIHIDGHLLVIHKDLQFEFDVGYGGFHHYDTLLCLRSWAQGRPVFTINLPLHHLGRGNTGAWNESSRLLGEFLGRSYANKSLVTSMGPVALNVEPGVTGDFYKQDVDKTLSRWCANRPAPDVILCIRVTEENSEEDVRETLLSACAQFDKPLRILMLCADVSQTNLAATVRYFERFVELTVHAYGEVRQGADDVLMGNGQAIRRSLPDRSVVAFLRAGTVLFPNFVRDIRRFHQFGIGVDTVVAALDFNRLLRETPREGEGGRGDRQVQTWKTESIDDIVSGGIIPLPSFAVPAAIARSIIDDSLKGALTERVFLLKLVARAPVFFLRRLGGLVRTAMTDPGPPDAFAIIADQSEFLRANYPFASLWKARQPAATVAPIQESAPPVAPSREQILAASLSRWPRFVDAVFRLCGLLKRFDTRHRTR